MNDRSNNDLFHVGRFLQGQNLEYIEQWQACFSSPYLAPRPVFGLRAQQGGG